MGKIFCTLTDKTERELRGHLRRKGDLSRIMQDAVSTWLQIENGVLEVKPK